MQSTFFTLMDRVCDHFGLEHFNRESDQQCALELSGYLVLFHYFEDSKRILVSTCVAQLPENNREQLCMALLKGQYFFQLTAGMTLSVNPEESFVALQGSFDTKTLLPETFLTVVAHFVQVAEYWENECQHLSQDSHSSNAHYEEMSSAALLSQAGVLRI